MTGALSPSEPWAPQTESPFSPHVFSACTGTPASGGGESAPGTEHVVGMRTLLLILYCTGLRFGEAVRLRMGDVDLEKLVIFVRESKGKSRLVPFGTDLAASYKVICAIE